MNLNEIGFQFIINLFNGNKSHIPNMGISFQNMLPLHQICRCIFYFLFFPPTYPYVPVLFEKFFENLRIIMDSALKLWMYLKKKKCIMIVELFCSPNMTSQRKNKLAQDLGIKLAP